MRTSPQPSLTPQIIVLANREPYRHAFDARRRLVAERAGSGVVNAVEPLLTTFSGVWVGEGVGEADRLSARDRDGVMVPPGRGRYRLRRVYLPAAERRGYYDGFANGGLWPLCHRTWVEPEFSPRDFDAYERVNRRFADAVAAEASEAAPVVLVQDYHFALAPALIRRQLPRARIGTFWHVPWPTPETLALCPWSRGLLEGLLGSSNVGFQTAEDCENFADAADTILGASVSREDGVVTYRGRTTSLGVFPASIQWPSRTLGDAPSVDECRARLRGHLGLDERTTVAVGVDRLDYTKGLEQKVLAVERLLERRPDLVGRFSFVQIAEPTRECVPAYQQTQRRLRETVARVNARFAHAAARAGAQPFILCEARHDAASVTRHYRGADLCYVGSLHDGMNLVSKEFAAARDDERGVLVLSTFAGAARELDAALLVNPYDIERVAVALGAAVDMTPGEQQDRMRRLRQVVADADASRWARDVLQAAVVPAGRRLRQSRPSLVGEGLSALVNYRPPVASGVSVS